MSLRTDCQCQSRQAVFVEEDELKCRHVDTLDIAIEQADNYEEEGLSTSMQRCWRCRDCLSRRWRRHSHYRSSALSQCTLEIF